METLSSKQQQVLEFIQDYYRQRSFPPSVREICQGVGLKSTSTVHGHLQRLEKKGLIRHDPACPRTIELMDIPGYARTPVQHVPIIGKVTAGEPILVVENIEGILPVAAEKLKDKETFALVVKGESMIDKGILEGDHIIVQRNAEIRDGDIVVALIKGEEATVKSFYREGDMVRLQPANPAMQPIYVHANDVGICGKVIGLSRWL